MSQEPRVTDPLAPRFDGGPRREIDWSAIAHEPEFQELVRRRRAFVLPATAFFLCWYMGFVVLTALAPDFMGERVYQGLTVGYVLALTQFVMVLVLGVWYLRKADRDFDPLAERIRRRGGAVEGGPEPLAENREGRHARTSALPPAPAGPEARS